MLKQINTQEPVWEIATLFPIQGDWTIDDYLAIDARTNHLIEYSKGRIEILKMPSIYHQTIAKILYRLLDAYIFGRNLGEVFFAPTKVRLWEGKIREPDVFFVSHENYAKRTKQWFEAIDLAIEIVSPDDPSRDLHDKRLEYEQAGIAEYWIVDPRTSEVTVLALVDKQYTHHGTFGIEDVATSILLPDFSVQVSKLFEHRSR